MDHATKVRAEAERRRRAFMQQRAVEQDRQAVTATYDDSVAKGSVVQTGVEDAAATKVLGPRPEELLDQVADRMTNRLRVEIREQLQKEAQEMMQANCNVQAKVEACLSEEIEKHCCPICYELMVPPQHTPMLSFPCGHTFCEACLKSHMKLKGNCPYCRGKIQSIAPNIALQQIIENFMKARNAGKLALPTFNDDHVSDRVMSVDPTELDDVANARRYRAEYQRVQMRIKILANEKLDMQEERMGAVDKCQSLELVAAHLHTEETRVSAEIEKLQAELVLIRDHLRDGAEQRQGLTQRASDLDKQEALIDQTLEPLRQERQKVKLLLQKFDPSAEFNDSE
jgi:hypothetical protein